jgi:hypothetical protein
MGGSSTGGATSLGGHGFDLDEGLVGHWQFDEAGGTTVADATGNGNAGQLRYGNSIDAPLWEFPQWVSGKSGSALKFSDENRDEDTNPFVTVPPSKSLEEIFETNELTVSAWVLTDASPSQEWTFILAKKDGGPSTESFGLGLLRGEFFFIVRDIYITHSPRFNPRSGPWHHVAATHSSRGESRLYVDGELGRTSNLGGLRERALTNIIIGANENENGVNLPWPGLIDEVKLWSRALSAEEIKIEAGLAAGSE